MTLPRNVRDAVAYVDEVFDDCDNGEWQTIRACLLGQEAELADYKNASLHAADDCVAKDAEIARLNRLLESMTNLAVKKDSQIKIAESRLAAANALLREIGKMADGTLCDEVRDYLQGAGDEA